MKGFHSPCASFNAVLFPPSLELMFTASVMLSRSGSYKYACAICPLLTSLI